MTRKRKPNNSQRQVDRPDEHWHPYTDPFAAYLAGNYEALHELEQQANADQSADARNMDGHLGQLTDFGDDLSEIPF